MSGVNEIDVTLGVLLKAREFLSNPGNWHKGGISDLGQRSFCILGSIVHVARTREESRVGMHQAWDLMEELATRMGWNADRPCSTAQFNDHPSTTHADVMAFVDRAIALRSEQLVAAAA
jgi:hypothetical protein